MVLMLLAPFLRFPMWMRLRFGPCHSDDWLILKPFLCLLASETLALCRSLCESQFTLFVSELILELPRQKIGLVLIIVGVLSRCTKLKKVTRACPCVVLALLVLSLVSLS